MNIAVIDVAAESSGALSILYDFVDSLIKKKTGNKDVWYIFTSIVEVNACDNIRNIRMPNIKKGWLHRLLWEYAELPKMLEKLQIDVVLSLQNNALPIKTVPQIVYLHNILFVQQDISFSFFRKDERIFSVYAKILAPYMRWTWKKAKMMVVQGQSVKEMLQRYYKGDVKIIRPSQQVNPKRETSRRIRGYIYPLMPSSYKNVECVLKALERLEQKGNACKILLTMNGDENSYAKKIRKMAEGLKYIQFIGFQERNDILEKYAEYGLIMVSNLESYAVPLHEAMCAGTVIVALDKPYVRDFSEYSRYNRLYVAETEDDLSESMLIGLKDEKEGNYLRHNIDSSEELITLVEKVGRAQ